VDAAPKVGADNETAGNSISRTLPWNQWQGVLRPMSEKQPVSESIFQPSDILTPEEVCARLKVRRGWIYEKMRQRPRSKNPIPVIKMNRLLRFSWKDISAWLAAQQLPARKVRA
jgi:predicted DNA-binding transcriptional regulator AlpA